MMVMWSSAIVVIILVYEITLSKRSSFIEGQKSTMSNDKKECLFLLFIALNHSMTVDEFLHWFILVVDLIVLLIWSRIVLLTFQVRCLLDL